MIRVERLSKSYGGRNALTDVTFDVARGEAVAISGAIGGASSTLLRIIATLIAPTSGRLDIDGIDAIAAPFEARRKLFWAGTPGLTCELSIAEYLELARAGRPRRRLDPERRAAILERAGVTNADLPLSTLTPGRRSLVDLAAAILAQPDILLIDEPFETPAAPDLHSTAQACALGARDRDAWLSLFDEARGHGTTFVIATTDTEVPGICDRLLSLDEARAA